jgi:hypothetical protein
MHAQEVRAKKQLNQIPETIACKNASILRSNYNCKNVFNVFKISEKRKVQENAAGEKRGLRALYRLLCLIPRKSRA